MPLPRLIGPAVVALIILFVLSSGCGDYVPNHDVIVIRLHSDGTEEWSRALDYGSDDIAADIIEQPGGDLVIAAGSAARKYEAPVPKLVRLSPGGTVISEHSCPAMGGELTDLIITNEGNLSASTYNGAVGRFDQNDNLAGVTKTGMEEVISLAPGPNGSIAVAGKQMERYPAGTVAGVGPDGTLTPSAPGAAIGLVGRNGTVLWQRGYGSYGLGSVWALAAARDGDGYWMDAHGPLSSNETHRTFTVRISENGSVLFIREREPAFLWFPALWDMSGERILAIVPREHPESKYPIEVRPEAITYDRNGNISARLEIFPASRIAIPVSDGGYFSAGYDSRIAEIAYIDTTWHGNEELRAMKFRANGSREWERTVRSVSADTIKKVIQTSDGGYVILAMKQNR